MLIPFIVPAAALLAGISNRARASRKVSLEYAGRFHFDANGVADGAQGFRLEGTNGKALLLLHGSGDTPQSLRYLAERLHSAGFTVVAPLLPGHGRSPYAFSKATSSEYHAEVERVHAHLRETFEWVGLVGLSMGGALATFAASRTPRVPLLVLLAPYFIPPDDIQWVKRLSWAWSWAAPYLRGRGESSVHDVIASGESRAYGSFSAGALSALVSTASDGRRAIPALDLPILVVNSETDNRITRIAAEQALGEFRAPVEAHWVSGCGHVITVDFCKARVADLVLDFLARHAG